MQALGSVCAVLSREQLEPQIPKLVPTILGMYKKEKELLPLTQVQLLPFVGLQTTHETHSFFFY
jgi:hypothetical protein